MLYDAGDLSPGPGIELTFLHCKADSSPQDHSGKSPPLLLKFLLTVATTTTKAQQNYLQSSCLVSDVFYHQNSPTKYVFLNLLILQVKKLRRPERLSDLLRSHRE